MIWSDFSVTSRIAHLRVPDVYKQNNNIDTPINTNRSFANLSWRSVHFSRDFPRTVAVQQEVRQLQHGGGARPEVGPVSRGQRCQVR